jgi:hypothetical protein
VRPAFFWSVEAGMASDIETQRERALQLFFERWFEQLETTFTPRRAR